MRADRLKKLQEKWDKKLKDSGFEDIENRSTGKLHDWSTRWTRRDNELTIEARREYYRAAGQFLYEHKFSNETEKRIWSLHSEGRSVRDIVAALKKEKLWFVEGVKPYRRLVHETIQQLSKQMMRHIKREILSD